MSKLTKIAEVELAGQRFDVAKNGEHYHLVTEGGETDAYDRPVPRPIQIHDFIKAEQANAQALLDALGEALVSLRGGRDLRKGVET